ncbi:MAG: PAS domain-containing sensor histidine kinase [Actinobacteria bacterium]|nr:PAS domain-containing sensor histidine kinase [Actinomycetota bacterium]
MGGVDPDTSADAGIAVRWMGVKTVRGALEQVVRRRPGDVITAAMLVTTIAFTMVQFLADRGVLGLPTTYAVHAPMLIALAPHWREHGLPRTRRAATVMALLMLASIITALSLGQNIGIAVATAGGALAYAIAVGTLYRRRSASWMPRSASQLLRLTGLSVLCSPIPLVVAGYVGVGWSTLVEAPHVALVACLRGAEAMIIGGTTVLPICLAGRPAPRRRPLVLNLVLVAAATTTPWLVPTIPNTPISWVLVLPMVVAAVLTTIRWVAAIAFISCISEMFVPNPPYADLWAGRLPGALGLDLLFGFMPLFALLIALARDHTARLSRQLQEATDAEQDQAALLSRVYEVMTDGMIVADETGTVTVANGAAARLAGVPIPARISDDWVRTVNAQAMDASRMARRQDVGALLAASGDAATVELMLPGDHGDARVLSLSRRRLRTTDRELLLHLITDITAERRAYRELESFAGTVAHDLKSPLTALMGWLETTLDLIGTDGPDGPAKPDRAGMAGLRHAQSAAQRMHGLIDDYLAYAVAREGALHLCDVPLDRLMDELRGFYETDGPQAVSITVAAPHTVHADPSLTRQLLGNLIGNSIKYSRPELGTRVQVRSIDHEPGWVQVQVADRGVGLTPGDEQRIFEAFNRSAKDAGNHAGIGLGLALCSAIVARHGGRIWAEANEWGGATFRFTLPEGVS